MGLGGRVGVGRGSCWVVVVVLGLEMEGLGLGLGGNIKVGDLGLGGRGGVSW